MKGGMNQILRQAQKMQEELSRVQEELANITVEGSSGGGMVKVIANCQNQIMEVKVEPEVIDPEEKEMLEDLIAAAVNQALENAQKRSQEEMSKVSGGLMGNLPGGFKLPGM
ncbi:MAG: YbaB/EbfC family nucleoid-associated protein [Calditrichia bacterium]|nr:YbaB/EbfC family nucleoid-associated protein [Calditrichia bacterium]